MTEATFRVYREDLDIINQQSGRVSHEAGKRHLRLYTFNPSVEVEHGENENDDVTLRQEGRDLGRVAAGEVKQLRRRGQIIEIVHFGPLEDLT